MTGPLPPEDTLLVLSLYGVPLYSARGLQQSLQPIDAAKNMRRTVNGLLVDLSLTKFSKYASKITCTDIEAPALDGVFPGMTVTVDCVAELVYLTAGGAPSRTVVSSRAVGAYTIYRPRLNMMIMDVNEQIGEYERQVQWEMDLEEV